MHGQGVHYNKLRPYEIRSVQGLKEPVMRRYNSPHFRTKRLSHNAEQLDRHSFKAGRCSTGIGLIEQRQPAEHRVNRVENI